MVNKFDITRVESGAFKIPAGSALFSFTGISFKLSRKILDYVKDYLNINDIKTVLVYHSFGLLHNSLSGNRDKEFKYDEELVDRNLKIGEIFYASAFPDYSGLLEIEQGNFKSAQALVKKLAEIGEAYDNDITRVRKYFLNATLLLKRRILNDALNEADAGIYLTNRIGQTLMVVFISGMKSNIQFLLGDIKGMEKTLLQAKELASQLKWTAPFYISYLLRSQFLLDLHMLADAIHSNDKRKIKQFRRKAHSSGKSAVKNAKKCASEKTEAFKLMGGYYWLIGRQRKALSWWAKSIKIGEYLGARPELARTYREVGKRLLEQKSKFQQLNGIQAEAYLDKARLLFQEMGLARDLEELDMVK